MASSCCSRHARLPSFGHAHETRLPSTARICPVRRRGRRRQPGTARAAAPTTTVKRSKIVLMASARWQQRDLVASRSAGGRRLGRPRRAPCRTQRHKTLLDGLSPPLLLTGSFEGGAEACAKGSLLTKPHNAHKAFASHPYSRSRIYIFHFLTIQLTNGVPSSRYVTTTCLGAHAEKKSSTPKRVRRCVSSPV